MEAQDPERGITKAQARDLTQKIAFFLREQYGIGAIGPGEDIIVAMLTSQSGLICLFFGVIAADSIYSAASPACTSQDLAR